MAGTGQGHSWAWLGSLGKPFSRLIYPVPPAAGAGLGTHLTLDLAGGVRFGPDVEWVDKVEYTVDPERAASFYQAIRAYWPGLPDDSLVPAYAGVRPKVSGPGQPPADFIVQSQREHGVPGVVCLYGIESPGLTASLAVANMTVTVDYREEQANCELFLKNFVDPYSDSHQPKYSQLLQDIANRRKRSLDIDLDDVSTFFESGEHSAPQFARNIERNTRTYVKLFAAAAAALMPGPQAGSTVEADVFDILAEQRRAQAALAGEAGRPDTVPPALLQRFDVYIRPGAKSERLKLRGITASHMGQLVKLRGVVTHITDVKPMVTVVAYTDSDTGNEIYQEVTGRTFMPVYADEKMKKKSVPPALETRGSRFVKYQEARIQESADEVPEGATPRTLSVHLRGEICRSAKPGDEVLLSGIFLPEPYTGFRAMRAGLLTSTYIEVMEIKQIKTSYAQHVLSVEGAARLATLNDEGNVYNRLSSSIAPEIFGHEDVKKALLLALVGGTTRHLPDGMKLRGDIHACLMGDPGVAKSQLLKYVARISPRAIYTTGKGSSGVGLTAAVMRNQVTKELVLEGGALVLADKGVCCIDEFDKMEEGDRTAIHEVMEQQTVSIAKAGITTTLNTRTTLLAAANPAWGRYDKRRTPAENINLPAALLSRFDLLWLILDEVNDDTDKLLAQHVLSVHRTGLAPPREGPACLPPDVLRAYIAQAKTYEPHVPPQLTEYVAAVYAEMRQLEASQAEGASATYTTPRTLLSILRLGQALAKLRFDNCVSQGDVDEALRLMRGSKSSLADSGGEAGARREDSVSLCYRLIREEARRQRTRQGPTGDASIEVPYSRIVELTAKYNIKAEEIRACIQEYADLAVWTAVEDMDGNPVVHVPDEDIHQGCDRGCFNLIGVAE
ncbi:hypothetical protein QJQ45_021173 [Haematococcus lacustris]|nr:hypothetical protein QJQ45_021173 [Haematococcus lacustris]